MKDIMSIKKRLEQKSAINGKAGVAIMSGMLNEEKIRNLVIKHYNSITCENEMKPEIILGDVPVFRVDTEGNICLDENGDPVLTLDFSKADKIMDFIKKHNEKNPDDTIRVRGHVLVWHSQTPDWFFREKYDSQGAYVGKEKMLKRLENYIQKVLEHYDGVNSPYRGIIYAWDVVNEQIEPDDFHPEKTQDQCAIHVITRIRVGIIFFRWVLATLLSHLFLQTAMRLMISSYFIMITMMQIR